MQATEAQIRKFNSLKEGDIIYPHTSDGFWRLVEGVRRVKTLKLNREDGTVIVEVLDGEQVGYTYVLFADELDLEKTYRDPHSWMDSWGE